MRQERKGLSAVLIITALTCGRPPSLAAQEASCLTDPGLHLADCNGDRRLDISDPVCLLGFLFRGDPRPACFSPATSRSECAERPSFRSADCNGDRSLDISDGVCLLGFLFSGGRAPLCRVLPACRDGVREGTEVCDDGNAEGGDACDPTCSFTNVTTHFTGVYGIPGLVDGPAGMALLGGPGTMAIDGDRLWIADSGNHAIRTVAIPSGEIATVAGAQEAGFIDHPEGSSARFDSPTAIATDGTTVWIGDHRRLRALSAAPPHGVTTAAGSGLNEHTDGSGASAGLPEIRGLTLAGGKVYFLDSVSATLRSFHPASGEVVTLAGTPGITGGDDGIGVAARFVAPRYMTTDGARLFIADTNGAKLRAYDLTTGEVSTLAGNGVPDYVDGPAAAARIHRPRGIAFDGQSLFWGEFNQHTVRQLVLAEAAASTLAGTPCADLVPPCPGGYAEGVGAAARLNGPFDLAYHAGSGTLFVLDSGNALVRRIR